MNQIRLLAGVCIMCMMALVLGSCVQTEIIPETLAPELRLLDEEIALLVGESTTLSAEYQSEAGIIEEGFAWSVEPSSIASIDDQGLLEALSAGQAWVFVEYLGLRDSALLSVVASVDEVVSVQIEGSSNDIVLGSTLNLNAAAFNLMGDEISGAMITWTSSDEAIASVDANGIVTPNAVGGVEIFAESEGINSLPYPVNVSDSVSARTGSFVGLNGYDAEGTATLSFNSSDLVLELGSDFSVSSGGAGLFLYLSNTPTGPLTPSNSVEISSLASINGAQSYTLDPSIGIDDYQYVIVHCRPFNIPFGRAELN